MGIGGLQIESYHQHCPPTNTHTCGRPLTENPGTITFKLVDRKWKKTKQREIHALNTFCIASLFCETKYQTSFISTNNYVPEFSLH